MNVKEYNDVWHDSSVILDNYGELVVIVGSSKENNLYTGISRLEDAKNIQWYIEADTGDIFDNHDIYKWAYCKDLANSIICYDNHTSDGCKNTEKPFY